MPGARQTPRPKAPVRTVVCADALGWMQGLADEERGRLGAVVTSLPDAAEVELSLGAWELWFEAAVELCFQVSTGPTVFIQTDRKAEGRWISKPSMIARATRQELLWHRIVLRKDAGKQDLQRPGYTHLLAYGPGRPGSNLPDVLPPGKTLWPNGTPLNAALMVCEWLRDQGAKAIMNPFSGHGTLLAVANGLGMDAYGCELSEERAMESQALKIEIGGKVETSG